MPSSFLRRSPPRLHRNGEGHRTISWLELFYDLVFVAALIQLGEALSHDVSAAGVAEFAALFALLWWAWTGTTFYANRFEVDDLAHRVLVFVQMFAIGNLAIRMEEAFAGDSAVFAGAYTVIRLTLVAMYVRAYRAEPDARVLARRFGTAFAVGAVLWLVSIFTPPPWRFVLWAAAVAADLLGRAAAGGTRATVRALPPDTAHMAERYATFTLIVLGESFIKIVDGIVEQGPSAASQVFAALGFLIVVALWWTYFDDVAGARIRDWQQRLGPGAAWIYSHLPLTLALTGFGVGVQHLALLSFGEDIPAGDLWLLAGSMAVALAALALLDWATESPDPAITERDRVLPRLVAAGAVLVVAALGGKLPALLEASLLALVALAQMAYEVVAGRRERSLTAPGRGSGSGTAPGPPRPG